MRQNTYPGEIDAETSARCLQRDDSRDEYLLFERLITGLSARFVNIAPEQVDGEIENALRQVLEFFQVDRCGLLGRRPDKKIAFVTHAWYAEGIGKVAGDINLATLFPWVYEKLFVQKTPVSTTRMEALPPEAETDRQTYLAMGVLSSLDIPVLFRDQVSHVIVIQTLRAERAWPEEFIPRLRLLGEIFVNALERRNADRALTESEARLSLAMDAAGVMPWNIDMGSGRLWTIEKAREFFGISADSDMSLESFLSIVHPEDREKLRRIVEATARSGGNSSAEYRIVQADGSIRWVLSKGRPYAPTAGSAARLMGVSIDITDRKRAEGELRESEKRLRDIIFSMADWVWEVDENGVYTYSSTKGLELFGHVVGKTPFDFMPPDEAKRVAEIFSEIAANKEPIKDLENWNISKDGERVCLLTNGVPILDKEGNLKGYRGVDKDITRHKQAEIALRKSEERYRGVVETQSEMICRFLPDTTLLFVNEAYMRYYGRSKEDLIGNKFLSHVPMELHGHILRYFASFVPGSPILTSQREAVFPDGERRWQEWTDQAFFDENGKLAGFQSVGRDITERKKAEETLRKSEAALRNSKKDLHRLAGRLIFAQEEELCRLSRELHDDLTQRLAVLAIEAGKLEQGLSKIPELSRETLQTISGMKDQLIKVSEDVHNISRQIHPTILDDLGLVRAIESECAALMRRENIEIIFSKEDVPAAIGKDIGLCLYRVLQESLKNIMTHSRARICRIFLKGADDNICLTVTDDGVGFDPVEVRHKPGLGLSSMRERVQLVHGDFSIKSQTGKGAVINVRVPLAGSGA